LYGPSTIDPSNVGFSLKSVNLMMLSDFADKHIFSMAVGFSGMILAWVRMFNDLEGKPIHKFMNLSIDTK
jgi:hypothetical protein